MTARKMRREKERARHEGERATRKKQADEWIDERGSAEGASTWRGCRDNCQEKEREDEVMRDRLDRGGKKKRSRMPGRHERQPGSQTCCNDGRRKPFLGFIPSPLLCTHSHTHH